MDRLKSKEGAIVYLSEVNGIVSVHVHHTDAVLITLDPDEAERVGQAFIRSAMIAREQKRADLSHVQCNGTTWVNYWPFVTRCTLFKDEHYGRKCIDRHGFVWPSTAEESTN